jgi:enoyl-CoA hydratase/carnithine racemase
MNLAELIIPPARLSCWEEPWTTPLAFVTLDVDAPWPAPLRLPPCPVIGLGAAHHPGAAMMDVLVKPAGKPEQLAASILAQPHAAAALVQVLRVTEALSLAEALAVESMAYAMLQGSAEHRAWIAQRPPLPITTPGHVEVVRTGARLRVTLDRAEAGNAIDRLMRDAVFAALDLAALDPTITQVDLRARGKAFSLGADLQEFGTTTDPATAHAIRALTLPAQAAARCAERMTVHVDGACVGAGLELAAFARRITATPRSWFQLPELPMGIIPGAGGCVSLPRRIGRHRTALMVLSGRRVSARLALAWGLVDALVDEAPSDESGGDIA